MDEGDFNCSKETGGVFAFFFFFALFFPFFFLPLFELFALFVFLGSLMPGVTLADRFTISSKAAAALFAPSLGVSVEDGVIA